MDLVLAILTCSFLTDSVYDTVRNTSPGSLDQMDSDDPSGTKRETGKEEKRMHGETQGEREEVTHKQKRKVTVDKKQSMC